MSNIHRLYSFARFFGEFLLLMFSAGPSFVFLKYFLIVFSLIFSASYSREGSLPLRGQGELILGQVVPISKIESCKLSFAAFQRAVLIPCYRTKTRWVVTLTRASRFPET